jgi:chromosome segregation ATPase
MDVWNDIAEVERTLVKECPFASEYVRNLRSLCVQQFLHRELDFEQRLCLSQGQDLQLDAWKEAAQTCLRQQQQVSAAWLAKHGASLDEEVATALQHILPLLYERLLEGLPDGHAQGVAPEVDLLSSRVEPSEKQLQLASVPGDKSVDNDAAQDRLIDEVSSLHSQNAQLAAANRSLQRQVTQQSKKLDSLKDLHNTISELKATIDGNLISISDLEQERVSLNALVDELQSRNAASASECALMQCQLQHVKHQLQAQIEDNEVLCRSKCPKCAQLFSQSILGASEPVAFADNNSGKFSGEFDSPGVSGVCPTQDHDEACDCAQADDNLEALLASPSGSEATHGSPLRSQITCSPGKRVLCTPVQESLSLQESPLKRHAHSCGFGAVTHFSSVEADDLFPTGSDRRTQTASTSQLHGQLDTGEATRTLSLTVSLSDLPLSQQPSTAGTWTPKAPATSCTEGCSTTLVGPGASVDEKRALRVCDIAAQTNVGSCLWDWEAEKVCVAVQCSAPEESTTSCACMDATTQVQWAPCNDLAGRVVEASLSKMTSTNEWLHGLHQQISQLRSLQSRSLFRDQEVASLGDTDARGGHVPHQPSEAPATASDTCNSQARPEPCLEASLQKWKCRSSGPTPASAATCLQVQGAMVKAPSHALPASAPCDELTDFLQSSLPCIADSQQGNHPNGSMATGSSVVADFEVATTIATEHAALSAAFGSVMKEVEKQKEAARAVLNSPASVRSGTPSWAADLENSNPNSPLQAHPYIAPTWSEEKPAVSGTAMHTNAQLLSLQNSLVTATSEQQGLMEAVQHEFLCTQERLAAASLELDRLQAEVDEVKEQSKRERAHLTAVEQERETVHKELDQACAELSALTAITGAKAGSSSNSNPDVTVPVWTVPCNNTQPTASCHACQPCAAPSGVATLLVSPGLATCEATDQVLMEGTPSPPTATPTPPAEETAARPARAVLVGGASAVLEQRQQGKKNCNWSQEGVHVDAQALRTLLVEWKRRGLDGEVPGGLRVMSQWELLIDDATDELSRLQDATDKQREALLEMEHEIVHSRSLLSRLTEDQHHAHKTMLAALAETETSKHKHSDLCVAVVEAEREMSRLKAEHIAIHDEHARCEKSIAALKEEELRLRRVTGACHEEVLSAAAASRKAAQDADETMSRQQFAMLKLENLESRLAAVQPELDRRVAELSSAQSALAETEAAMQTASLHLDSLETEISDLTRERATLDRACRELEQQKSAMQACAGECIAAAVQTVTQLGVGSKACDVACQAGASLGTQRHVKLQCDGQTAGEHTTLIVAAAASAALDEEAQVVQEAIDLAKTSLAEQRRKLQELHLQHSLRQSALDSDHAARRDTLDAQLAAHSEELHSLEVQVTRLRHERSALQTAVSNLEHEHLAVGARLAVTENAVRELEEHCVSTAAERKAELEASVALHNVRHLADLERKELHQLQGQVQAQLEELHEASGQAEAQKGKLRCMKLEIAALEAAKDAAQDGLRVAEVARAAAVEAWEARVRELQVQATGLRATVKAQKAAGNAHSKDMDARPQAGNREAQGSQTKSDECQSFVWEAPLQQSQNVEGRTNCSRELHGDAAQHLAGETARLKAECMVATDMLAALHCQCCAEQDRCDQARQHAQEADAQLSELQAEVFELSVQKQQHEQAGTQLVRQAATLSDANCKAQKQLALLREELSKCQQDLTDTEGRVADLARDEASMEEHVRRLERFELPRSQQELQKVRECTASVQSMEASAQQQLRQLEVGAEAARASLRRLEEAASRMEFRAAEACREMECMVQHTAGEEARLEALEEQVGATELDAVAAAARLDELQHLRTLTESAAVASGPASVRKESREDVLGATAASSCEEHGVLEEAVVGVRCETNRWEKVEQELPAVLASFERLVAQGQAPCIWKPSCVPSKAGQSEASVAELPSVLLNAGSDAVCRMCLALERSQRNAMHEQFTRLQEQVLEQQQQLMWQAHELSQLEVAQQANVRLLARVDELSMKLAHANAHAADRSSSLGGPADKAGHFGGGQGAALASEQTLIPPPSASAAAVEGNLGSDAHGLVLLKTVALNDWAAKDGNEADASAHLDSRVQELEQECVQLREGREQFLQELMEQKECAMELRSELTLCHAELAQKEAEVSQQQSGLHSQSKEPRSVHEVKLPAAREGLLGGGAGAEQFHLKRKGSAGSPLEHRASVTRTTGAVAAALSAGKSVRIEGTQADLSVENLTSTIWAEQHMDKECPSTECTASASKEVASMRQELTECREELMRVSCEAAAKQETLCAMWSLCRQAEAQSRAVLSEIRSASTADALAAAATVTPCAQNLAELGTVWKTQRMLTAVRRRLVAAETQRARLQARLTRTTLQLEDALLARDRIAAENAHLGDAYMKMQSRLAAVEAAMAGEEVSCWGQRAEDVVSVSERMAAEILVSEEKGQQGMTGKLLLQQTAEQQELVELQDVSKSVASSNAAESGQLSTQRATHADMDTSTHPAGGSPLQEHDMPQGTVTVGLTPSMSLTSAGMLSPDTNELSLDGMLATPDVAEASAAADSLKLPGTCTVELKRQLHTLQDEVQAVAAENEELLREKQRLEGIITELHCQAAAVEASSGPLPHPPAACDNSGLLSSAHLVLRLRASAAERSSTVAEAVARAARARVDVLAADARKAQGKARDYRCQTVALAEALRTLQLAQAKARQRVEAIQLQADVLQHERDCALTQVQELKRAMACDCTLGLPCVAKATQTDSDSGYGTAADSSSSLRDMEFKCCMAKRTQEACGQGERLLRAQESPLMQTDASWGLQRGGNNGRSNAATKDAMAALLAAAQEVCETKKLTTVFRRCVAAATGAIGECSTGPLAPLGQAYVSMHNCEGQLAAADAALTLVGRAVREASNEGEAMRAATFALHKSLCEALAAWERRPRSRRVHRSAPPTESHAEGGCASNPPAKLTGRDRSCHTRHSDMGDVLAALCELSGHAAATQGSGSGAFGPVGAVLADAPTGVQRAAAVSRARAKESCNAIADVCRRLTAIRLALPLKHRQMKDGPPAQAMSAADVAEELVFSALNRAQPIYRPQSADSAQFRRKDARSRSGERAGSVHLARAGLQQSLNQVRACAAIKVQVAAETLLPRAK